MLNNKKIVAIIPARGGSKGIPRKNARLLAGNPLLAYTIINALKSEYIDHVYVSTDCPVLSEIALKFGAKIIHREQQLAKDDVGIDEVIVHAVNHLENNINSFFDIIISVQATSPFISSKSIDLGIEKCVKNEFDTVVSVTNDPHLQWGFNSQGDTIPLYEERKNRQYLKKRFKETGGFVVCHRQILETKTRFGKNSSLFEVTKEESVDIDDRFDWWLAEKTLLRKKICFHVIGSKHDGLGHVYRALTIADRIMDHEIHFIVNEESDLAILKIKSHLYSYTICKKGEELETIINKAPDLVINDILNTDFEYMNTLRSQGIATINFEDLGKGSTIADIVINELYDFYPYPKNDKVFQGSHVCCLRSEFFHTNPKEYSPKVTNIFILIGATDPEGITLQVLKWIDELEGNWTITVILGLGDDHEQLIRNFAHTSTKKITIIKDTPIVSKYMKEADIAITAAGRTLYELTSLGIPMIAMASTKRELSHSLIHNSFGVISLGLWKDVNKEKFHDIFLQLLNSNLLRHKMRKALLQDNLHKGIENVIDIIHDTIKSLNNKPIESTSFMEYIETTKP